MSDNNNINILELNDDMFEEEFPKAYTFDRFKSEYPKYLDSLNNYIKLIYNTYVLVHTYRFITIKKSPEYYEIAAKCGFGMLMRHALETISTSIATENGIEVGGRSVFERLNTLKGQNIEGYDKDKKKILFDLLDITNDIAHPHVLSSSPSTFNDLKNFYDNSFKPVLEGHIQYITNIAKKSRIKDFGIPKEVSQNRKQSLKYLKTLKKQLEKFNLFNKATNILTQGCLVRQLTECTANRWGYNCGIVPTDVSTYENQINMSNVLTALARISRANRRTAFGTSALTEKVVNNLFDLKNASNGLMHVDKFASGNLEEQGTELSKLYTVVQAECSPHVMNKKLNDAAILSGVTKKIKIREKSPFLASLLCGFFGWFGAHQFYAGRISKGIIYLLFGGFIIGPALDLFKMVNGKFRDSKGFYMKRTKLSYFSAIVLLIIHLILLYTFATKVNHHDLFSKLMGLLPTETLTVTKCEYTEIENLDVISVLESESSSHLKSKNTEYTASLCTDGNPLTCWQDGVEGNGEGESLTFKFENKEPVIGFSILNGKQKSEKAFTENARAQMVTVEIDGKSYTLTLDDTMEIQAFRLDSAKEISEISFIINSAYPGGKWEDLCISEIGFYKEK
ncbi:MAG: NINE protein [Clostridia bacterium]|nr:NINE protein [Clostridia bacterium]